jgi:putative ATP-dependent endonuclease of OLD family
MNISKVRIENFKIFKGSFVLQLNDGMNILVGNNEAGKSTIIEAIHLALTGLYNGKYLKNELTEYLFNKEIRDSYIASLKTDKPFPPPYILIEIYFGGNDLDDKFRGSNNSDRIDCHGIKLEIKFDENYKSEYNDYRKLKEIFTIPIEYYDVYWTGFDYDPITTRTVPLKSALIDSSSIKFQNGSDIYISRIVRNFLETKEIVEVSQAHRSMKEEFMKATIISAINKRIQNATNISNKKVELSVELSSKNAWENSLITQLDDIPFHNIGKGEQCMVKTKLALVAPKTEKANVILFEEPENHLSHSKLNHLVNYIANNKTDKQVLISTHNSFVANKLGLENIILLDSQNTFPLKALPENTFSYFKKLAGYDTLRLILCKKAILVEGDSDELVVQKAYFVKNGRLPIEDEIDVISVGTSFKRFLEIAEKLQKNVSVVTDSDGDVEALSKKYKNYLGDNKKDFIDICFDNIIDTVNIKKFNYDTLEPKLLKANSLEKMNTILGKAYTNIDDMHKFMKENKTECALKVFETEETLNFPEYILNAIR